MQFSSMGRLSNKILSMAEKEIDKHLEESKTETAPQPKAAPQQKSYDCPHCKGHIEDVKDISPSGDTRCSFCDKWFNVYQSN